MSSITLRKAQPRPGTDVPVMERRWNPSPALQIGNKLVGEQGQETVVAAWLKAALIPDHEARTTLQEIHTRLVDAFPFPPAIPPPSIANDLLPVIKDALPGIAIHDDGDDEQIAVQLQTVDFERCAEIWAGAGWDLTVWVLQYVQSRLSVNNKGGIKEEDVQAEDGHGLVGTGVGLTCSQGTTVQVDEARGDPASKVSDTASDPSTTIKLPPPPVVKPAKPSATVVPVDKIPDAAFTLLNTSTLPFPHLSIRKNFRTTVVDSIPVSKILPNATAGAGPGPGPGATAGAVADVVPRPDTTQPIDADGTVDVKEPEMQTFKRIVSTGKYTTQVLGKPGSVRVAKAWLHAWLVPSAAQNISSVTDLTSSTTSKRNTNNNNKDTTTPVKHVEPTMMIPLTDVYDVYARYGFHPPSCPALPFEEFHDLLRPPSGSTTTTATAREPVWTQPTTGFVLRHDIPLDLLRPAGESTNDTILHLSPQSGKLETAHSASPRGDTTSSSVLVQASFRYPPDEWIDPEPYLALTPTPTPATAPSDGTKISGLAAAATPAAVVPVTKGKHFKEHDLVWRSVGLNFARWVKAERGKRMAAKVEMVVAGALEGERERERKRQRLEYAEQQGRRGGPVPVPVSMPMNGGRQGPQASVFARPAQVATPEERRRVIMSRWLNENYKRHGDPNLRIEQKSLWQAFLAQVVRVLPPWESDIFTYMRPNELFGLTTEMWGTKLSAEEVPPGPDGGPARQTFWICGIVPRPSVGQSSSSLPPLQQQQHQLQQMRMMPPPSLPSSSAEQKMNPIQPRNPLMHAVQQMPPSRFEPNPAYSAQPLSAMSSSRPQGYPSYPAYQQQQSFPTSTGSQQAYPPHPGHQRQHPQQQPMVPSMGSGGPRHSYPPLQHSSERSALPALASPRNSLSGYLAPPHEQQQHHSPSTHPSMYAPAATSSSHHPIPHQPTSAITPLSRGSASSGMVLPPPPVPYQQSRMSSLPSASGHPPMHRSSSHPHGDGAGEQ